MIPASPHYSFLPFHPCSFHFSNAVFVTTLFTVILDSDMVTQRYPAFTSFSTQNKQRNKNTDATEVEIARETCAQQARDENSSRKGHKIGNPDRKTKHTGNCDMSFWPGIRPCPCERIDGRVPHMSQLKMLTTSALQVPQASQAYSPNRELLKVSIVLENVRAEGKSSLLS